MILVDTSEPKDIIRLIEQSGIQVIVMPLNQSNKSDYYFGSEDGKTLQFSRKQTGELMTDINEAEAQIRKYYDSADENYQVVEGILSPYPLSVKQRKETRVTTRPTASIDRCFTYKVEDTGWVHGEHVCNGRMSMLYAWLHRLDKAGVTTYWTTNSTQTATLLVAIYKNRQKPEEESTTLQRYIRPRIVLKSHHPLVEALMGLSHAYRIGIGEEKALAILEYYPDILSIAMAQVSELMGVAGIGKTTAERLLTALGRRLDEEG